MIIGIGIFIIGLISLLVIGGLFALACEGELIVGICLMAFIPLIIGIYEVGQFVANEMGWL